jgi:hypothetical protein
VSISLPAELDTPALVVDVSRLDDNSTRLAAARLRSRISSVPSTASASPD